jgi:hypothetical protein
VIGSERLCFGQWREEDIPLLLKNLSTVNELVCMRRDHNREFLVDLVGLALLVVGGEIMCRLDSNYYIKNAFDKKYLITF